MKKELLLSTAAIAGTTLVGANATTANADTVDNGENVVTVEKQQVTTKDEAQANLTDAKAQQAKAQEKVDNAQADLNNAKSNVADSTEAVHNAQAKVDHAKESYARKY